MTTTWTKVERTNRRTGRTDLKSDAVYVTVRQGTERKDGTRPAALEFRIGKSLLDMCQFELDTGVDILRAGNSRVRICAAKLDPSAMLRSIKGKKQSRQYGGRIFLTILTPTVPFAEHGPDFRLKNTECTLDDFGPGFIELTLPVVEKVRSDDARQYIFGARS